MRRLFLVPIVAILLGSWACAVKQPVTPGSQPATTTAPSPPLRPGAINQFDQTTYDTLMVVQASLNAAKPIVAANHPTLKPQLNQAIAAYNTAEAAYKLYHSKAITDPTFQASLAQQLADLTHKVAELSASLGGKIQ